MNIVMTMSGIYGIFIEIGEHFEFLNLFCIATKRSNARTIHWLIKYEQTQKQDFSSLTDEGPHSPLQWHPP